MSDLIDEFDVPPNHQKIWRYMSWSKFLSILECEALFFTRGDRFDDSFEGSLPRKVCEQFKESQFSTWRKAGFPPDEEKYQRLVQLDRKTTGVSCWHISEGESDAMWRLYTSAKGDGVAIQSTVGSLIQALSKDGVYSLGFNLFVSEVEYIDYDSDQFDVKSQFSRFLYKRKAFEHERELRAMIRLGTKIVSIPEEVPMPKYQDSEPLYEYGKAVKVDLHDLIKEIRIPPGAKWMENLAWDVAHRYGLKAPVKYTELDGIPNF